MIEKLLQWVGRTWAVFALICVVIGLCDLYLYLRFRDLRSENLTLKSQIGEIVGLSGEFLKLKKRRDLYRRHLYKGEIPPSSRIESVLEDLDLGEEIEQIRPLGLKEAGDLLVEPFEVRLRRLTMSEVLRVLESFPRESLLIRSLDIGRDFTKEQNLSMVVEVVALKEVSE